MVTSTDIVNQAIQLIGDNQPLVTGTAPTFDNSVAGKAAAALYTPCVQTVGRQWGWDFARNTASLTLSGGVAPFPWTFEYLYPGDGIEIWQLAPPALSDPNNPLPIDWDVANKLVGMVQKKVLFCNVANVLAIYNNMPNESTWDPLFREAVVRLLASEMAMAITGRPDTAQALIESGAAFETIGEGRPD